MAKSLDLNLSQSKLLANMLQTVTKKNFFRTEIKLILEL